MTTGTAAAAVVIGLSLARAWTAPSPSLDAAKLPSEGIVDCTAPSLDRQRFFILSTGRTGSSLLAAILADAGADFGITPPQSWDRRGGEMEHRQLTEASRLVSKANAISRERPRGIARLRWTFLRSRAKQDLRSTLRNVRYVKVAGAHELVRPAFKLGYFPIVILSYRRFEDYSVSLGLMHANATLGSLASHYRSTLQMGLWLLNTFGGCVVGYEQLVDPANRSWAGPLAEATGIPIDKLVTARDRRVTAPSAAVPAHFSEAEAVTAFEAVDALYNRHIPCSAQAVRSWQARRPVRS